MKYFATLLIITLSLWTLGGCTIEPQNTDQNNQLETTHEDQQVETVLVLFPETNTEVQAEIADDFEERRVGLMNRQNLEDGSGMLFIFEESQPLSFWMKDTFIPLDIIYIDENKKVIQIYENAEPLNETKLYPSNQNAQFVLEVPGGYAKKNRIQTGQKVEFDLY